MQSFCRAPTLLRRFLNRHEALETRLVANCRVSIETVASPVFRSFPGNGKKFRRKMTIITADLSLRKYKVFRKTANPRAVTLSISIAIRFSFRYRTIVSIGYFHRTTTSFLLGESLDPPQFCPFLTSIGVIRRSCPVESGRVPA